MARKTPGAAIAVVGLLGASGAAAAIVLATKRAKAKDPTKDPTTTIPDVVPPDPDTTAHATIGRPYKPGAQHGKSNAWIACSQKPVIHPAGVARGKYSLADWLTWVTFLETWPKGPIKFESDSDRWATEWRRLYKFVHECLAAEDAGTKAKGHQTVGHPYSPGRSNEAKNAKTAARLKPGRHPVGLSRGSKELDAWLTDFVYWESNPQGPVKITKSNDKWAKSWLRIRAYVRAALRTPSTTDPGKEDPKDKTFPVIGGKFRVGQQNERHNAVVAVELRPSYHPRKQSRGSTSIDNWLSNVAFWETWHKAPTKIKDPRGGYARSWKTIRGHVRKALAAADAGKDPKKPKVIGRPFAAGRSNEKKNAVLAVSRKPAAHPNGQRRQRQNDENWYSNLAYWESYPQGPIQIKRRDKTYADAWKRIRGYVRRVMRDAAAKTTPSTKLPPGTKPGARMKIIGAPFKVGNEKHNAVLAVTRKPNSHPNGKRRGSSSGETWYTNVAFWETVGPAGPIKIAKRDKNNANRWIRIRGYVRTVLKKQVTQPGSTPGSQKQKSVPHGLRPAAKIPDTAQERRNAKTASEGRPSDYPTNPAPYNRWNSGKQKWLDWLTNVVLWGTYPDSPVKLTKSARDKKYVAAWVRIRKRIGTLNPKPPAKPRTQSRPAVPRPQPSPQKPPAKIATSKANKASASEMRNAAIVVADQPRSFEKHGERYKKAMKLSDWYTNVAYWSSYPEGPKKLSKASKDKSYVAAWLRIQRHVKTMLALRRKIPGGNPAGAKGSNADRQWLQWALAMRVSSNLKTPATLASAFRKSAVYFTTPPGRAVLRSIGEKAGPFVVSLSGLIAEAAVRVPSGKLSSVAKWKTSPTRSFWVTTSLF